MNCKVDSAERQSRHPGKEKATLTLAQADVQCHVKTVSIPPVILISLKDLYEFRDFFF